MAGRGAKIFVALSAVLSLTAFTAAAAALPLVVPEPLQAKYDASFSPKSLSKGKRTPIAVRTSVRFWKEDGSQVPALEELQLRFDRGLHLDLEKVPPCSRTGLGRFEPEKTCRDAVVARGMMKVDLSFPEAAPVLLNAKATVFKGDASKGAPPLFLFTELHAPVSAQIVAPIEIKPVGDSRYGLKAAFTVPKIAGGSGSITRLDLRFRRGIFAATCPSDGSLLARFNAGFAEGSVVEGVVKRACD